MEPLLINPDNLIFSDLNNRTKTFDDHVIKDMMMTLEKSRDPYSLPAIKCRYTETPGIYEVCYGQHRVKAYRACGMNIPAIIQEMDDATFIEESIKENFNRSKPCQADIDRSAYNLYLIGKDWREIADFFSIHSCKEKKAKDMIRRHLYLSNSMKLLIDHPEIKNEINALLTKFTLFTKIKKKYQLNVYKETLSENSNMTIKALDNYIKNFKYKQDNKVYLKPSSDTLKFKKAVKAPVKKVISEQSDLIIDKLLAKNILQLIQNNDIKLVESLLKGEKDNIYGKNVLVDAKYLHK